MRLQLVLNVDNIDSVVDFHSRMFGAGLTKRNAGHANYEIAQLPLKPVLDENPAECRPGRCLLARLLRLQMEHERPLGKQHRKLNAMTAELGPRQGDSGGRP